METVTLARLGPDGRIITIGPGIESLTGIGADDFADTLLWEHLHPGDRDRTRTRWLGFMQAPDGSRRNFRARLSRNGGEARWVEISAVKATEEPGLESVVVSMQPFAQGWVHGHAPDQKMASLRDQPAGEQFLRLLLNLSADAVLVLDDDFRIKWASAGAESSSGWSAEDFERIAPADLVHPDDLEKLADAIARWRGDPGELSPDPVTIRLRHSELGWRHTDVVGRDLRSDPHVAGIAMAFNDADTRVRAEQALASSERRHRALVRGGHERVLLTDADGTITWASQPSSSTPLEWRNKRFTGQEMGSSLDDEGRAKLDSLRKACIEEPGPSHVAELLLPGPEGTQRWIEVIARNMLADPDVASIVWNFRDVHEQRQLLAELESASEVFKALAVSSRTGLFEEDAELGCLDVNPRWEEITGITAEQAMGDGWHRMVDDDYLSSHYVPIPEEPGPEAPRRTRIRHSDGEIRWLDVRTTVVRMPDGRLRRFGGIEDVTEVVLAEQERQRFLEIFDLTSDMVMVVGADGTLIFMNRAGQRFHGLTEEDYHRVVGTTWPMTLQRSPQFVEIVQAGSVHGRWSGQVDSLDAAGEPVNTMVELLVHRDPNGRIRYFTAVTRDITATKELEATLEHQASHDDLTGLPNRKALLDGLEALRTRGAELPGWHVTALFIDLDQFKVINDSLGHEVGDLLLRECAERITAVVRPGETVARFGGDEFVVLCRNKGEPDDGDAIAARIDASLSAPFDIGGHRVHTTVSIGIASIPVSALDPHELIRDADTAMYHAKSAGRRRWAVFDDHLRRKAVSRQQVEDGLRRALDADQLTLEFQPVASLSGLEVVGAEALLRWRTAGAAVPPAEFIPVAEDTGLIGPIGSWVLSNALRALKDWTSAAPGGVEWTSTIGISINVSVRQLQTPGFVAHVAALLAESGVAPHRVTLEITETVLLEELSTTGSVLAGLKDLGVHIALDDFGTGYSPLTYLKDLPIDEVKLDRSFVAEIGTDQRNWAIASAVISLADAMSLRIVAEGIENEIELEALRDLGCGYGQGYLISPPLTPEEFSEVALRLGAQGELLGSRDELLGNRRPATP